MLLLIEGCPSLPSCCGADLKSPNGRLDPLHSIMAREKAQRKKETTLVPHITPNLSALLQRAQSGDAAQAVKSFLDAGGMPMALVQVSGEAMPLLHSMVFTNAHPHRELAESVRLLVAAGANIDAPYAYTETLCSTALMCAAVRKCCTAVPAVLLEAGADPCAPVSGSATALHRATRQGSTECCKLLLEHEYALLEAKDTAGRTALHHAAETGQLDNVQLLLQYGADVNTTDNRSVSPLVVASLQQHVSIAACLLEAGADVNAAAVDGNNVLIAAVESGSVALVQLLLDHGADISATNNKGQNALFRAARAGHVALLGYLVQRGLSVHSTDNVGHTLLMLAVIRQHEAAVEWSIQHGVAVNAVTSDGSTALHCACMRSSGDSAAMVELLLANGADVHMCNDVDSTALDTAAYYGSTPCAKALIAAGAEVNHNESDGHSTLHIAIMANHAAVAQLLLEHGATAVVNSVVPLECSLGATCCTQATALMMCSTVDTVKVLLAAGADVHVTTAAGDTCLQSSAAQLQSASTVLTDQSWC
jgi:uncharacterized protein